MLQDVDRPIERRASVRAEANKVDDTQLIIATPPVSQASVALAAIVLDTCMLVTAALLAGTITGPGSMEALNLIGFTGLVIGLAIVFNVLSGAYETRHFFFASKQIYTTLSGMMSAVFFAITAQIILQSPQFPSIYWLLTWGAFSAVLLTTGRIVLATVILNDPEQRFASRAIIIGTAPDSGRLAHLLHRRGDRSLRLLGYVDDHNLPGVLEAPPLPFLGPVEGLFTLVRRGAVDEVIIAPPWSSEERTLELLHRLSEYPVHVRLAPGLVGHHLASHALTDAGGVPLMRLLDRPISGWAAVIKRTEDIVLAATALVLLTPLLATIALVIKLDSPGPILFRQRRVGFNNLSFEMLKFRSMYQEQSEYEIRHQAVRGDPRVTRVGAILRRLSFDELPQLVNVLRGEMSVVGPRPHAPGTRAAGRPFEDVVGRYAARHRVKPGITGLAQVRGYRGETETEDKLTRRIDSDLEYIERWSLWLDLIIIARTAFGVLRMKNAW